MTDILNPSALIPAGTIIPYLGGRQLSPPTGWLFCDGSLQPRATYGDLFAAIGSTYGFSSSADFRLPTHSVLMRGSSSIGFGAQVNSHQHGFSFGTSGNITDGSGHGHSINAPSTSSVAGGSHGHSQSSYPYSGANGGNFKAAGGTANLLAADSHTHIVYQSYSSGGGAHQHAGVGGAVGSVGSHAHSYSLPSSDFTSTTSNTSLPASIRLAYIIKT